MTLGLTDSQYYSDIANAIRAKRTDLPSNTTFSPSQMADAISGISGSGGSSPIPSTPYHWVRPSEWPDLDSVYNDEKNTIWMTVDATGRFEYPVVKFSVSMPSSADVATIQFGTIENGVFNVTGTETRLRNADFSHEWTPSPGFYPVIKVTANSITNISFSTSITTEAGTKEPSSHIIEWIGHADYVITKTPPYVVHEAIGADLVASSTTLSSRWYNCYSLVSLDLSGWDTEDWNITTLYYTWRNCYSLRELNLSGWDTTNWAVTSLESTWENCYSLMELDVSGWNTTNWEVTNLTNTWNYCGVESLDLSGWDTSNWAVTTLRYTWGNCHSLRELDISGWDTENWEVESLYYTWSNCSALRELDISGWNTENWIVTALTGTWTNCSLLRELDISGWDTENWEVESLYYTWSGCRLLTSLDISGWDTKKWAVTNLGSTWSGCRLFTSLDLSGWDTSNWAVTSLSSTWGSCYSLTSLDLSGWDTENWEVDTLSSTWSGCASLVSLDLSGWDTTGWEASSVSAIFNNLYSIINLQLPQNFFSFYTGTSSIAIVNSNLLTRASILSIFNSLPTISGSKTIQIGSTNKNKMTAEEIAIATNKGWTVS